MTFTSIDYLFLNSLIFCFTLIPFVILHFNQKWFIVLGLIFFSFREFPSDVFFVYYGSFALLFLLIRFLMGFDGE